MIILSELIIGGFLLLIYWLYNRQNQRYQFLNKYKVILNMLENFLDKTYQVIYNDQLLAYTVSGTTNVQKDQLETIERNFIKLSFEVMGPKNEKLFIDFFGTRKVFIDNIVLYFRQRLENDEISKLLNKRMMNNE